MNSNRTKSKFQVAVETGDRFARSPFAAKYKATNAKRDESRGAKKAMGSIEKYLKRDAK